MPFVYAGVADHAEFVGPRPAISSACRIQLTRDCYYAKGVVLLLPTKRLIRYIFALP